MCLELYITCHHCSLAVLTTYITWSVLIPAHNYCAKLEGTTDAKKSQHDTTYAKWLSRTDPVIRLENMN